MIQRGREWKRPQTKNGDRERTQGGGSEIKRDRMTLGRQEEQGCSWKEWQLKIKRLIEWRRSPLRREGGGGVFNNTKIKKNRFGERKIYKQNPSKHSHYTGAACWAQGIWIEVKTSWKSIWEQDTLIKPTTKGTTSIAKRGRERQTVRGSKRRESTGQWTSKGKRVARQRRAKEEN